MSTIPPMKNLIFTITHSNRIRRIRKNQRLITELKDHFHSILNFQIQLMIKIKIMKVCNFEGLVGNHPFARASPHCFIIATATWIMAVTATAIDIKCMRSIREASWMLPSSQIIVPRKIGKNTATHQESRLRGS